MSEESGFSRRHFIWGLGGSIPGLFLVGCSTGLLKVPDPSGRSPSSDSNHDFSSMSFFSADERVTLGALCNEVFPNATSLGAVLYIETLLTAFESNPPRIFAGGPSSGRNPFDKESPSAEPSFAQFQPLNRVQEAAWKLRIYGSKSVPGGYWNEAVAGPVVGLRDLMKQGIQDSTGNGKSAPVLGWASKEFKRTLSELVVEACFSAPEYGGNHNLEGWKLAHFAGDAQPKGYSIFDPVTQTYSERPELPISTPDSKDPEKMSLLTAAFCYSVALFQGGRTFK